MNSLDPNIAQQQAASPAQSVWVAASAGTGKTKVLTDRVLNLMLAGAEPRKILCLTFTKAAAAEMSNRIADRLGTWTRMSGEGLEKELSRLLGRSPAPGEKTLARQLFVKVLDVPGGMRIQTIHAFCQSLLQQFPLEAGLPPAFKVMDDRDASVTLAAARDHVLALARRGQDAALSDAVSLLTALVHETSFPELLVTLGHERDRLRRLFEKAGSLEAVLDSLRTFLDLPGGQDSAQVLAHGCADAALDLLGLRLCCEALQGGSKTDMVRGDALARWLESPVEVRTATLDTYAGQFLTGGGTIRKTLITKNAAAKAAGSADILMAEAQRVHRLTETLKAARTLEATGALLVIARSLLSAYQDAKRSRGLLDYDDLILETRQLLSEDTVAWVMYKLDGGIDHILVDEAQDTNPDQWTIIRALSDEFFAGLGTREAAFGRTVFAVGDIKQSIYSFQGADPAAFEASRSHYTDQVIASGQDWAQVPLTVSFRSTRAVLKAVDAVFANPPASQGVGEGIHHEAFRAQDGGRVEIWPAVTPRAADPLPAWKPPVERLRGDAPATRLAGLVARKIAHMIDSREILASTGEALQAGDFLVLVRRRSGFVEDLVKALKDLDVPVAGSDRMVLVDQIAIMDMMALGRFLLLPDDDLSLAEALKSPLFGLDDDDLFALAWQRKGSLWEALKTHPDERFADTRHLLTALLGRVDRVTPYDLFSDILTRHGGHRQALARLGPDATDPLAEFLAMALHYERDHVPSLQGFLAWMAEGGAEIKRELDQGSGGTVRIMTVHGAKGLQAPVVFLPDTLQAPTRTPSLFWTDDAPVWLPKADFLTEATAPLKDAAKQARDEEYRRLLYVAMTRAEDRLYVCGWETRRAAPEDCWYHLIRNGLEDVATECEDVFLGNDPEMAESRILVIDSPQLAEPDAPSGASLPEAAFPALPGWARTPPADEPTSPRPLAPSRPSLAEPAVRSPLQTDNDTQRFQRGRLIHSLLQTLPDQPIDSRDRLMNGFLSRPALDLEPAQIESIKGDVLRVLDHPDHAALFGPGSRAEVSIVGEINGQVISGQVDRLVIQGKDIRIIDYKTNRPPPARVDDVPKIYLQQMAAYRAALTRMQPESQVSCLLLWTDNGILMSLPDNLLDPWMPGAA